MKWLAALLIGWPLIAGAAPRIAIIIDDLGYHRARGEAIVDLPAPVTCAVIPETPFGPRLAERAASLGKEVIIHLPMETEGTRPLDQGGLRDEMSHARMVATVREAFVKIPQARGLNNHMGSILTADEQPMTWLMQELAMNHYFFIDSRTTAASVAEQVARRHGLRTAGRDIFLDNERDLQKINRQFNKLLRVARKHGQAIAIGHPYPETIAYLKGVLPLLKEAGVEVVPVSALLAPGTIATAPETKPVTLPQEPGA